MKYLKDWGYMSVIETISDVNNTFLSRREITCNFNGLAGKLKKLEAADMITKEFKIDGKIVIPIEFRNHVGKPIVTGTFYVYDDEELAKKHVDPTVFSRIERAKKKVEEAQASETPSDEEKKTDVKDESGEEKESSETKENKTEEKVEEKQSEEGDKKE